MNFLICDKDNLEAYFGGKLSEGTLIHIPGEPFYVGKVKSIGVMTIFQIGYLKKILDNQRVLNYKKSLL